MELLVVVGIIGVLVAILLPSLQRAREQTRMAVCRSNLGQLWKVLNVTDGGEMRLPEARHWLEFVTSHGAGGTVICPNDDGSASLSDMEDVYMVQDPGGLEFYPILECIEKGNQGLFQLEVFNRGGGVWELWIGNYMATSELSQSDADAAVEVKLGSPMIVTPLDPPGDGGPGDPHGCGSDHWLCDGPNCGTGSWREDVVVQLTGMSKHNAEPPYYVSGGNCSYGMNARVPRVPVRTDQLLLMDYERVIADPVVDNRVAPGEFLAPRHLGRQNAIFVDGSVRTLWPWEVDPDRALWKP